MRWIVADKAEVVVESKSEESEELPTASPPDHEFASDAFTGGDFSDEDLKKEMQMLGMTDEEKARAEANADGRSTLDTL